MEARHFALTERLWVTFRDIAPLDGRGRISSPPAGGHESGEAAYTPKHASAVKNSCAGQTNTGTQEGSQSLTRCLGARPYLEPLGCRGLGLLQLPLKPEQGKNDADWLVPINSEPTKAASWPRDLTPQEGMSSSRSPDRPTSSHRASGPLAVPRLEWAMAPLSPPDDPQGLHSSDALLLCSRPPRQLSLKSAALF